MMTSSLRTLLRARASSVLVAVFFVLAGFAGFDAQAQPVCAEVKIQIDQKLSLERQGFIAEMRIVNGLDTTSLTEVGVNIQFADRDGNAVVATTNPDNTSPEVRFFYREDLITGIAGGVSGSGTIQPKTTGVAQWLIIPTACAGGETPAGEIYAVGATLTYKEAGEPRSVTVTPEIITVRPQPLLELDYFLPEDVYGDDPFTVPTEPSEPFTLGVIVSNSGAGPARNVSIESAQPKIIDNDQGFLVGFQIDGSYVQDEPEQNTLLIDFGDIDPARGKVGRWVMSTTVSGRFSEFEASYTHADELGGAATSLLQRVTTHTLLKDVYVDLPGRDTVRDFFARDADTPRVYESDGLRTDVADQSEDATITGASGGGYRLQFEAVATATWVKILDPTGGQIEIGRVERSDGKVLRPENFWKSREKLNNATTFTHYLNLFDIGGTGDYLINPGSVAPSPSSIGGHVYLDADEDGQRDPTEQGIGGVVVSLAGIDTAGAPVHRIVATDVGGVYHFDELAAGTYSMQVGISQDTTDGTHTAGSAGGVVGADRIEQIVLAAGVVATGYDFAKLSVAPPASADLVVEASFNPIEIEFDGTSSSIGTILVRNAGPDATTASVVWQLPLNATLIGATASLGTIEQAQARWTLPSLAPNATAELQLQIAPTEPGSILLNATVAGAASDPVAANNAASAALTVLEPEVEQPLVEQEIDPAPRVLALVLCRIDDRVDVACTNQRATRLSALLAGLGVEHTVVTNTLAYREALRSRRYNVHWISGALGLLSEQLAEEIRNAVRRGDGLLIDGLTHVKEVPSTLTDLAGVRDIGESGLYETILTLPGIHPADVELSVLGSFNTVAQTHTTLQARFILGPRHGGDAVFSTQFGDGRTLFHAFELIDSATEAQAPQPWIDFVDTSLTWLTGGVDDETFNHGFLPVLTRIENPLDEPATVEVGMSFDGMSLATSTTGMMTGHDAADPRWSLVVPARDSRSLVTGLRVAANAAAPEVETTAIWKKVGGDVELPVEHLRPGAPTQMLARYNAAIDALNQMILIRPAQIALRNATVMSLTWAREQESPQDIVLAHLINAERSAMELEASLHDASLPIGSSEYVPVDQISALVQESGLKWHALNPVCGAANSATVTLSPETFWPFADSERMEARGGSPLTREEWEWGVGTDVEAFGDDERLATIKEFPWKSGLTYNWTLTYLDTGEAQLTVAAQPEDNGGIGIGIDETFEAIFSPRLLPGMRSGSAVRLSASLSGRTQPTQTYVTIDEVNGMPATAVLDVGTETTREGATVVYLPAMQSGMSLTGTLRVDFTNEIPYGSILSVQVHAGDVACRPELTP